MCWGALIEVAIDSTRIQTWNKESSVLHVFCRMELKVSLPFCYGIGQARALTWKFWILALHIPHTCVLLLCKRVIRVLWAHTWYMSAWILSLRQGPIPNQIATIDDTLLLRLYKKPKYHPMPQSGEGAALKSKKAGQQCSSLYWPGGICKGFLYL